MKNIKTTTFVENDFFNLALSLEYFAIENSNSKTKENYIVNIKNKVILNKEKYGNPSIEKIFFGKEQIKTIILALRASQNNSWDSDSISCAKLEEYFENILYKN